MSWVTVGNTRTMYKLATLYMHSYVCAGRFLLTAIFIPVMKYLFGESVFSSFLVRDVFE